MFYSTHDLCDQIKPDTLTLIFQVIPFFLIPLPDAIQCVRIGQNKSTNGISPTSVLLRFLFCTVLFSNALVLPYTFAAAECCEKRSMTVPKCLATMLVVAHTSVLWLWNGLSTAAFLFYYTDRKPRILSSPTGSVRLSAPFSTHQPWTPGRAFLTVFCLLSSVTLIPISLFYIIPVFPATSEVFWITLETWSFGLNLLGVMLAVIYGIPQMTLTARLTLEKLRRRALEELKQESSPSPPPPQQSADGGGNDAGTKDHNKKEPVSTELVYLMSSAARWIVLAVVWTTWFGQGLYDNFKLNVPVMWIMGANVYWDYLIAAGIDTMTAWIVWRGEKPRHARGIKGKALARGRPWVSDAAVFDRSAHSSTSGRETGRSGSRNVRTTERTPLLNGIRWHESGGPQIQYSG